MSEVLQVPYCPSQRVGKEQHEATARHYRIALAAFLATFGITAAFAADSVVSQNGWQINPGFTNSSVNITGHTWNPRSLQCVLYSTLLQDFTVPIMVQAGNVVCYNSNLDGSCTSGHQFVEHYDHGYFCRQGGTFVANSSYHEEVWTLGGDTIIGTADDGTSWPVSGFSNSDRYYAYVWAEVSSASATCEYSPSSASFSNWTYTDLNGYQHTVNGNYGSGSGGYGPCWAVYPISSSGSFNVSH